MRKLTRLNIMLHPAVRNFLWSYDQYYRKRCEHLRAVADYSAVFLVHAGQEAGNVNKGDERYIEAVAEGDEPCGLIGSIYIQAAGHNGGLVGQYANALPANAAKAGYHIFRIVGLHLEEVAVVNNALYMLIGGVADDGIC